MILLITLLIEKLSQGIEILKYLLFPLINLTFSLCLCLCFTLFQFQRATSLSCLKSRLKEVLDLELQAFHLTKEQSLSEAVIDWYTNEICSQCLSNESTNCNESDTLNLFIITDDALHPYVKEMIHSLIEAVQSPFLSQRNCKCCNKEVISEALI